MFLGSITSIPHVLALIAIGFCVGVAGSFFGVGGAFIVTPALNILGFRMVYAIATDLAHMTGKSLIASIRHWRLGHVDFKAAAFLLLGSVPGLNLGHMLVMRLEHTGATEHVIRWVYVLLLTSIGTLMLRESLLSARRTEAVARTAFFQRHFRLKPLISLEQSRIKGISVWSVILLGFATGFLASFLGVGGGFIRMPALLYLMGMPAHVAVGTDLLEVFFSGGYGTFLYALDGKVNVLAALIMLVGAAVGSHLGALATCYAHAERIRFYFALTVLGDAVAVLAKEAGYQQLSAGILLTLGITLTVLILWRLVAGIRKYGNPARVDLDDQLTDRQDML